MALGFYFHPESMTAKQYDEVTRQLEAAGVGMPKGRMYHSAFGPPDKLMVFDIWDSQANFDAFGEKLMPILAKNNVDPGTPDVMPVHNVIKG